MGLVANNGVVAYNNTGVVALNTGVVAYNNTGVVANTKACNEQKQKSGPAQEPGPAQKVQQEFEQKWREYFGEEKCLNIKAHEALRLPDEIVATKKAAAEKDVV